MIWTRAWSADDTLNDDVNSTGISEHFQNTWVWQPNSITNKHHWFDDIYYFLRAVFCFIALVHSMSHFFLSTLMYTLLSLAVVACKRQTALHSVSYNLRLYRYTKQNLTYFSLSNNHHRFFDSKILYWILCTFLVRSYWDILSIKHKEFQTRKECATLKKEEWI